MLFNTIITLEILRSWMMKLYYISFYELRVMYIIIKSFRRFKNLSLFRREGEGGGGSDMINN